MCSIEDNDNCSLVSQKLELRPGRLCDKCKTELAAVALRDNDISCRDCFLKQFTHKFRAVLGKSGLVKHGEKVLLAYSGGNSSTAMLHLVKQGFQESTPRKLKYSADVLYIDGGNGVDESEEERQANCEAVLKLSLGLGFKTHVVAIDKVLQAELSTEDVRTLTPGVDIPTWCRGPSQFQEMLASVKSLSSKEDLLLKLRSELICRAAKTLGYSKVFVGDSGQRLAVQLLTRVAQGQGSQLPLCVGLSDTRWMDVMLLRPMTEFVAKEVVMYITFNKLDTVALPYLTSKLNSKASIGRLTEAFVCELQAEFPATVSTIFRTGQKLGSKVHIQEDKACILCKGPLDTDGGESSAVGALEVSRRLCAATDTCTNSEGDNAPICCSEDCQSEQEDGATCCRQQKNKRLSKEAVAVWLCYSCRLVLDDLKSVSCLPSTVLDEYHRLNNRSAMRSAIKDFLIEDDLC